MPCAGLFLAPLFNSMCLNGKNTLVDCLIAQILIQTQNLVYIVYIQIWSKMLPEYLL